MDETKEDSVDGSSEKHSSDESFPWEEWTVIDGQENPKNHATSRPIESNAAADNVGDRDSTSDAEEARECIQVPPEVLLDQCPSVASSEDSLEQRNDESDGVSVITESDVDDAAGDANGREVVLYENVSRSPIDRMDGRVDRMVMKVLNVMIACSLVAVIGLGAGRILNVDNNRPISTELDLVAIKMENSRIREQMNELSGVKEILEEIKASMLHERVSEPTDSRGAMENLANELPYSKKPLNTLDPSLNQPENTPSERLEFFLRAICLVVEDIRQPNDHTENFKSNCDMHSTFSELKNLHALLNGVIDEMDPVERSTHQRFLQNVKFQMNAMSDSLVSDLTRALEKLSVKNQKRLGKISSKLNERLCVLRNTLPSDSKLRESLEMNDTFVDGCVAVATKKSKEPSKKKLKEGSTTIEILPKSDEKKFVKPADAVNSSVIEESRRSRLRRQNATSPYDTVDTRKCYDSNLSSYAHDSHESDDTCALLLAPPRYDWKLKHDASKSQPEKFRKDERKKLDTEWPDKILLKGDREASQIWKKKTKEFKKSKLRKSGVSSHRNDDIQKPITTKERSNAKTRPGAVLSEPPMTNPDGKYKRTYPPNPTSRRLKKNIEKENNEFIVLERRYENSQVDGNWQFERSRIREQLRNDVSTGNWYFDRVGNRKNSRMNCEDEKRDPRCGTLRR